MIGDHIGQSLRRLEDDRFLPGRGRYVDDIAVPGQLHGVVLRSPHGHALIEGIDATAAPMMPGVHGIFMAADLDADGIGPLPCR
jgi:aerobic carbon-monoxide dehydrogenase large subunit